MSLQRIRQLQRHQRRSHHSSGHRSRRWRGDLPEHFQRGPAPDKLWLNLAYTFNDFRFDNDATFGNNLLPGAPRHYLRAELLYKHPTGFYFGPNLEWVPQAYYVDSANTLKTEAYALLGTEDGF